MYPRAERRYSGLEWSIRHEASERLSISASYVFSRTHGNYPGLFNSDLNFPFPTNSAFDAISIMDKSTGLLPNDRTHVAKLIGRYDAGMGVTVGVVGAWESGTPLSEFVGPPSGVPAFLTQRGTAGRTPAIWDLGARIGYELPLPSAAHSRPRVTLDLMHIGSPREPVTYDLFHYFSADQYGIPTNPNPNYRQPTQYQPGFAVRIGMDVGF